VLSLDVTERRFIPQDGIYLRIQQFGDRTEQRENGFARCRQDKSRRICIAISVLIARSARWD